VAALLLVLAPISALAQGAPWVLQRVHGVRFALAVESVYESAAPGTDPRHARRLEHRLRVAIQNDRSGRAVPMDVVAADVAESGYAGTAIALTPVGPAGQGLYEGRIRLSTESPHRILILATPAEGGRTLEAQFDYRHHH